MFKVGIRIMKSEDTVTIGIQGRKVRIAISHGGQLVEIFGLRYGLGTKPGVERQLAAHVSEGLELPRCRVDRKSDAVWHRGNSLRVKIITFYNPLLVHLTLMTAHYQPSIGYSGPLQTCP